jgi:hypothetical protein
MTTALIVSKPLTPSTWEMISSIAPAMHQSRLFGVASAEQAMAIMLKGYELGLSLTASFEFVQVVQGRPALSPRGALALILQSPELEDMKIEDKPGACTVWMKRKNGFEYTCTYTLEDAKKAGLVKDDSGWKKYEANMLRWRAIGFCADVVFPDVIGGMKRADELGADITPEGDVINGSFTVKDTEQRSAVTLEQLVAQYSPERVMEVAGGRIPATQEELEEVARKLGEDINE